MRSINRILIAIILLLKVLTAQSQNVEIEKDYRYMHMLSADELYQKVDYNFQSTAAPVGPVRAIAEWEQMSAVLVRYPFGVPVSFIKTLADVDTVITIVYDQSEENSVRSQYESESVDMTRVKFFHANSDSYWTRDYGPWFIIDGNNDVSVLNFNYNRPRENDNTIPQYIDDFLGMPYYAMNVVHTGGNYMTDGYGSSASTSIVYSESEDLGFSSDVVDSRMLNYMGIDNHIVVTDPNNTYIDHVDCWGKFLDVDKILIRKVSKSHNQYDEVEAMADYWANKTSKWGNNYQVYRVYSPNDQPYTNSLILNKRVFVPITGSSNDNAALEVYRQAMPGYQVIGVTNNTYEPWLSTDALHCRTHEIADKNMLCIMHYPLLGQQDDNCVYTISANIDALSGAGVNDDSVKLYVRYNSDEWQCVSMVNISGNTYSASIPNPAFETQVSYYITAADSVGKTATHPFIGSPDPHQFTTGAAESIHFSHSSITFTEESFDPIQLYIANNGTSDITISSSNYESLNYSTVTPLNSALTVPFSISAGDSVGFEVAPLIVTKNANNQVNTESLQFTTTQKTYGISIATDESFMNGVEDESFGSIVVYPNPFVDVVTVAAPQFSSNVSAKVYSVSGAEFAQLTPQQGFFRWNAASMPRGLYIVKIEGKNGIRTVKVVKI